MYAHLNDAPPSVAASVAGVPPALDEVIAIGMAKDPATRYASAGDLARAAWAALQGDPVPRPAGSVATGEAPTGVGAGARRERGGGHAAAERHDVPAARGQPARPAPAEAAEARRRAGRLAAPPPHSAARRPARAARRRRHGGRAGRRRGARRRRRRGAAPAAAAHAPRPTATATPSGGGAAPDPAPSAATIDVGDGPDGVAVDGDSVFVSNSRAATLMRIDADDQRARRRARSPSGENPDQIAAGKGVLWVADNDTNLLQRFQTEPELVPTATVQIGQGSEGVSLGQQLVWAANTRRRHGEPHRPRAGRDGRRPDRRRRRAHGHLRRLGGLGRQLRRRRRLRASTSPPRRWRASRSRWATARAASPRVSAACGSPTRTTARCRASTRPAARSWPPIGVGRKPKELVAAHGFVWVVNSGSNTVSRIDPATNRLVGANLPVGREPVGIAAGEDSLWVTNFGDDTRHPHRSRSRELSRREHGHDGLLQLPDAARAGAGGQARAGGRPRRRRGVRPAGRRRGGLGRGAGRGGDAALRAGRGRPAGRRARPRLLPAARRPAWRSRARSPPSPRRPPSASSPSSTGARAR